MYLLSRPLPELLLRLGVAFSFLYPALSALSDPYSWLGYFPGFILSLGIEPLILLHVFGAVEVVLALWILLGKNIFIPSLATVVMLLAIVLFNLSQFPILFRDVSIALMAIALMYMHHPYGNR